MRGDEPLTIIHYTSGHLDKVRPAFAQAVRDQLLHSAGGYPIITVSHQPLNFGDRNIVVENAVRGHLQIYKNILIGARAAETEFVGLAEDDVLAPASHWRTFRPPLDKFGYDLNRWGLNTWSQPPMFGYRSRIVVNQLIAPRQLLVDALEERFAKYPDEAALATAFPSNPLGFWGDLGRYEKFLGVTVRSVESFAAPDPSVVFSHEEAFGFLNHGKQKSIGQGARSWLPYWGSAQKMVDLWSGATPAAQQQSASA